MSAGSSPRVRSRLYFRDVPQVGDGIISACAEQTSSVWPSDANVWDHLRVCGADLRVSPEPLEPMGSSPRVRSRLRSLVQTLDTLGIISACAEQTTLKLRRGTGG